MDSLDQEHSIALIRLTFRLSLLNSIILKHLIIWRERLHVGIGTLSNIANRFLAGNPKLPGPRHRANKFRSYLHPPGTKASAESKVVHPPCQPSSTTPSPDPCQTGLRSCRFNFSIAVLRQLSRGICTRPRAELANEGSKRQVCEPRGCEAASVLSPTIGYTRGWACWCRFVDLIVTPVKPKIQALD